MLPRANWKGILKIAELTCQVGLYTAASTSDRIAFHTINRRTGHRIFRQYVDAETGEPVERDAQVKGYETGPGEYVILEPEEIAASVPTSDKTLTIESFISCNQVDDVYFDRPYYLVPTNGAAEQAYAVLREAMRKKQVAALARTVLFRRMRTVLIRSYECGLVATILNFDYEVRPFMQVFSDIPDVKISREMLELAEHIITTKMGRFDPKTFDDRYESALAALVKAKMRGRKIRPPKQPKAEKVVDLLDALRQSAKTGDTKSRGRGRTARPTETSHRRAG